MKKLIDILRENYLIILGVLIFGILAGYIIGKSGNQEISTSSNLQTDESTHQPEGETADQIWTCSMHPQIKQDKPGQCPICGMDLIPLETGQSDQEDIDPDEIQMTESAAKLADIQTIIVEKGIPNKEIFLQGKVQADERRISELTARFGGRIEKLFVNFTGEHVTKGEKLATVYSPELVTAQRELLEATGYKDIRPALYNAARGKLRLWDLTGKQIDAIEKDGEPQLYFDILSPITGTVTKRHVALGDYVKEGSALFEVIDLTHVWIMFDAYESDLPWLNNGDKVKYNLQSLPGKSFQGKVVYIDPFIDPGTRVAKVRVEQNNPGLLLKPEMFANGLVESIAAGAAREILIPKSSILWTGKRAVVYVKMADRDQPSFKYREIELGPEAGKFYVVSTGLDEGEEIAAHGVFKIDAAAQLAGKPSMMNPEGGKISTGHNHGGTPMSDEEMANMDKQPSQNTKISGEIPMDFKMQLGEVVKQYLLLKNAFVESNEKDVEAAAKKTLEALNKVDMTLLKGDAHNQWMKLQKPVKDNLNGIIQMKGIEMKRSHFSIVSDKLSQAIKAFGVHNNTTSALYLEFCPMAFDNKGAFWISETKEIKNPYFGEAMLTCGEVKETIK